VAPHAAAGDGGPYRADASAGTPESADVFDLVGGFGSLAVSESRVWRELAQAWGVEAGGRDPCAALEQQQLRCFRTARVTLATIRQLDRPGILTLRDAGNRPAFVLLGGLSDRAAWLNVGGELRRVPLVSLADFWRGEFSTLWRVPPGYSGEDWATWPNPGARWLARQLSAARGDAQPPKPPADDASLRGMVHAFQLTQGLPSDGVAGPMTLMQLNRAVGIDEPRLAAQR
jgi:general secretion pathway protein A